jgi:N-acetylglucosamine-6-sulfatase
VDDVRWDDLGCAGHPFVKTPHVDRIAREGAHFRNAFAATPLCSPSRATLLTGLYAHAHGITDNSERGPQSRELDTFPRRLQQAGYATAFVGKWHMGTDAAPRPGFTYWAAIPGQGSCVDSPLNEDGRLVRTSGHVTDALTEKAVQFVRRAKSGPFLLYLAHKAVHPDLGRRADGRPADLGGPGFVPAERHRDLYAGARIPRRPNALRPPQGKPALQRTLPGLPPPGPDTGTPDEAILGRLRMLAGVDEGVGRLFDALEETGQLDRTFLVFTSDHGYFYGEHGLNVERRLAYEESLRVPLLIRYPPLVRAGSTPEALTVGVDLAPTCLDLAGVAAPPLHGRSLVPLLKGEGRSWRTSFLAEYFSDSVWPRMVKMGYQAVRTDRHKYIRYVDLEGMDELYDLRADPYEMTNLAHDPASRPVLERMKAELAERLRETGG